VAIGKQCAGGRCDNRGVQLLASSALVEDATIAVSSYWQAVHWQKMQHWKGAVIGKQCAGGGWDTGRVRLLASRALAEDGTLEGHNYWQAEHWRRM